MEVATPAAESLKAYREDKMNCAQSVLCGFKELLGVSDEDIEAARKLGGGRAAEGRCGALHSALQLSTNPQTQERLKRAFQENAGSEYCREIRAQKQLRCDGCVELAANVLAQEEFAE